MTRQYLHSDSAWLMVLFLVLTVPINVAAQGAQRRARSEADTVPTLGIEQGFSSFDTPYFDLTLVNASQTVAALKPKRADGFDFTPNDRLERRNRNGFFHLGDLTLRMRAGGSREWQEFSTASERAPVVALPVSSPVLAAADLAATLPADIPLEVRRYWEVDDEQLVLRFELTNRYFSAI